MLSMVKKLGLIANGMLSNASSVIGSFAVRILQGQSIASKVVEVQRLDSSRESPLVFDLTVKKHHCYLANGLLVSNSDAFLNLAVGIRKATGDIGDDGGGMVIGAGGEDNNLVQDAYEMDNGI